MAEWLEQTSTISIKKIKEKMQADLKAKKQQPLFVSNAVLPVKMFGQQSKKKRCDAGK